MPSPAELEHSRQAIRALSETLGAVVGGYPEDDPDKWRGVTTDGMLELDGVQWAVDHLRATWDPSSTPASDDAQRTLEPRLAKIATRHQVGLFVSVYPPRGADRHDYYDEVVALAEACALSGTEHWGDDGMTTLQFHPHPGEVVLSVFYANHPGVGGQIAAGLVPTLKKKLAGQLGRAKAAGFQVGVLIDQTQSPEVRQGNVPYGHPNTVAEVVLPVLAEAPGVVDRVWLCDHAGAFHTIFPVPLAD